MLLEVTLHDVMSVFVRDLKGNSIRYLSFSIPIFLLFYVWRKRELFKYKIQQKFPANKQILREIGYSALTIAIFSTVGTLIFILRKHGYTKIYTHFGDHSVAYFIFSIILFIVMHDTYFYLSLIHI